MNNMNSVSEERMKEMEDTKAVVKNMNVEAVAELLTKVQEKHHEVMADNVDMKRMVTDAKQEILVLRGEINALKAMGFRGNMGTGSTVHNKDE